MTFLSPEEWDADSPPQGGDRSPEAHPTTALAPRAPLRASCPQLPPGQAPVARFLHQQFLAFAVKLSEVLVRKVHLGPPPSIVPFGVPRFLVRLPAYDDEVHLTRRWPLWMLATDLHHLQEQRRDIEPMLAAQGLQGITRKHDLSLVHCAYAGPLTRSFPKLVEGVFSEVWLLAFTCAGIVAFVSSLFVLARNSTLA